MTKVLITFPYVASRDLIQESFPKYLALRGHTVSILLAHDECARISTNEVDLQRSEWSRGVSYGGSILSTRASFLPARLPSHAFFRKSGFEIAHINNLPFVSTHQLVSRARESGVPSIVHIHGVTAKRDPLTNLGQGSFLLSFGQNIFRNADRLLCVTKEDASEINRYGCPREKISIIPNGVDIQKFRPERDLDNNHILWIGRFVPEKRPEDIIEAVAIARKSRPEIRLFMAGNGPRLSYAYRMIVRLGLHENVKLLGYVPHQTIPTLINSSSLCVMTSSKEGMPLALLEEMACGRPILASDIAGIRAVISNGNNGVLYPCQDTRALARTILEIMSDPERKNSLGRQARKVVETRFDIRDIVTRLEELYTTVIQKTESHQAAHRG